MNQKFVMEILASILVIVVSSLMFMYMHKRMGYTQTEAEEEAHLRRLFGDAWKQAKDL